MTSEGRLSETARYYLAQMRQTFDLNREGLCAHGVRREHCADHSKPGDPDELVSCKRCFRPTSAGVAGRNEGLCSTCADAPADHRPAPATPEPEQETRP